MPVITPAAPMTTLTDLLSEVIDSDSITSAVSDALPSLNDVAEVVETIPSTIDDIAEVISDVVDDVAEIDADDLADTVADIEDATASDLTSVGDGITLAQVQDLFDTYFASISKMLSASTVVAETNPSDLTATDVFDEEDPAPEDSFGGFSFEPRRGRGRRGGGRRGGRRGFGGGCNRSGDGEMGEITSPASDVVSDSDEDQRLMSETLVDESVSEMPDTFEVSRADVSLENVISGERVRGRESVIGTGDDDLIAAGRGRDRLSGRSGADNFLFDEADAGCGRRQADVIRDFDADQGDRILLDSTAFEGDGVVSVAESRRDFQRLRNSGDCDFIYYQPRGGLYYNENGDEEGFGEGGLMASIKGAPDLTTEQIALV